MRTYIKPNLYHALLYTAHIWLTQKADTSYCFSVETSFTCDDSDDNNGVIIALATLLVIAIIGLVISIVVNVFLVVQRKKSRCVVSSSYTFYVAIVEYCYRYDVDQQSNIRYSEVKKSVTRDNTVKDPTYVNTVKNPTYVNTAKPSESEYYESIKIAHKPDHDVKMFANPAYHATS